MLSLPLQRTSIRRRFKNLLLQNAVMSYVSLAATSDTSQSQNYENSLRIRHAPQCLAVISPNDSATKCNGKSITLRMGRFALSDQKSTDHTHYGVGDNPSAENTRTVSHHLISNNLRPPRPNNHRQNRSHHQFHQILPRRYWFGSRNRHTYHAPVAVIRIAVVVIVHSHILILLYLCVVQGKMVRAYRI